MVQAGLLRPVVGIPVDFGVDKIVDHFAASKMNQLAEQTKKVKEELALRMFEEKFADELWLKEDLTQKQTAPYKNRVKTLENNTTKSSSTKKPKPPDGSSGRIEPIKDDELFYNILVGNNVNKSKKE